MTTQRFLLGANVLSLALFLGAACTPAEPGGGGGTGGSTATGGAKPAGTGGSAPAGTGGTAPGTGGTVAPNTGGMAAPGTGGSPGTGGTEPGTGGASGTGGSTGDTAPETGGGETAPPSGEFVLKVTEVDMRNGKLYFKRGQTRDTGHMSPAFEWGAVPEAKSYALSMVDTANNNTHWVMYDIPATVTKLPPNLAHARMAPEVPGALHTSFAGGTGYFGPGANCRTYNFQVHALKVEKLMTGGASNNNLRTQVLTNATNLLKAAPPVGVIGQANAGMCN